MAKQLIILIIILIGLLLRVWNFHNLFYFAIDEEKAAYIINGITSGTHFPTVGHPSSIGFRLGPLQYYLLAPFYKLISPSPVTWGYLSVAVSFVSMILIYKLGSKIGRNVGIFSLFFYNFSFLNIIYDRRGWQLSFHSLLALSILYSILKIKKGHSKYAYILTLALIGATHFEVATILFVPFVFFAIILFKLKFKLKIAAICILLFIISHLGLLIFDLRHQFINSKYLLNYFSSSAYERIAPNVPLAGIREVYLAHNLIPSTLGRTLFPGPANLAIQYANCPQYLSHKQQIIPPIIKLAVFLLLIYFLYTTIINWGEKDDVTNIRKAILLYLFLLFSGTAIYTYFFNGEMAEYYLLSSFAYFFIVIGILCQRILNTRFKWLMICLALLFMITNSQKVFTSNNPYGLNEKIRAINYSLSVVKDKPFILDSFQTCWYSGGYRYLYTLAGHEPAASHMDQYLNEYYTPNKSDKPQYQVVILTPELTGDNPTGYEQYRSRVKKEADNEAKFGAIEVLVKKL